MLEMFGEIREMVMAGRNPLDIREELNVPDAWIQAVIKFCRVL